MDAALAARHELEMLDGVGDVHRAAIDADLTQRGVPAKYWLDVRYQRAITATEADVLETLIADLQSGAVSWSEEKH